MLPMKQLLASIVYPLWLLLLSFPLLAAAEKPNILMIVIDDMGSGDMSGEGHPWLKTPNLDRLRAESVRMTDFMVSPTCAPTRAALMTGAHEFRSGVTHTIFGMEQMNREVVTLPQVLKTAGYATGMFGKWHLGHENGHEPWKRGFDIGVIAADDSKNEAHRKARDPVFFFNGKKRQMKGTRDHLFAQEAMRVMKQEREKPFFCYFATYDPHSAYWAEARFMKEIRQQVKEAAAKGTLGVTSERRNQFFAEVLQTDWMIGEILDFLEEEQLADNTLVHFVTDNGATTGVDVYNKGMRGHKTTAWVGGTRALSYWRWPGVLEPRDLPESYAHIDVLPTLAELTGADLSEETRQQIEGRSAWKQLTGETNDWPERYLHAHVARWAPGKRDEHKYQGALVRRGDYDLVRIARNPMSRHYTDFPEIHGRQTPGGEWSLYDRKNDLMQEHDLSAEKPELRKQMSEEFERWWKESEAYLIHE